MNKILNLHLSRLFLYLLLIIFTAFAIFLAINLEDNVVPDESYRFEVSQHFAQSRGVPDNYSGSYSSGIDLKHNPYLGYWIFGRALNIFDVFMPAATESQQLVFLRIVNAASSLGTVIFTYLASKLVIKSKWLQLLPAFFLTNTLMFVFLSGGVSYDNLANLACAAGIYFLLRVFVRKEFLSNSLAWILSIAVGSLIKHTILPLALVMAIFWAIYTLRNRQKIEWRGFRGFKTVSLVIITTVFVVLNISLYGGNLIKFQSLTPNCQDTFSKEICDESVFVVRHENMALPEKLTLFEAVKRGFPEPIRYIFDEWIREMLKRTFGIMGHKDYFPINISYFHMAFFWIVLLAARYIKKPSFIALSLMTMIGFYSVVLINMNYNSELVYGFYKYVALQGRNIFPVISAIYLLVTLILEQVSNKYVKLGTVTLLVLLFLYGGPIRFILYYQSVFSDWFI